MISGYTLIGQMTGKVNTMLTPLVDSHVGVTNSIVVDGERRGGVFVTLTRIKIRV